MRWAPDMVWLDVDPIIPRYPDELSSLQLLNGIVEVLEQGWQECTMAAGQR